MTPRRPPAAAALFLAAAALAASAAASAVGRAARETKAGAGAVPTLPPGEPARVDPVVSGAVAGPWPRPRPQVGRLRRRRTDSDNEDLDRTDLKDIYSISCLKAKQLSPNYPCKGFDRVPKGALEALTPSREYDRRPLGLGNFPYFKDPDCRSGGELFCDPGGLLSDSGRNRVLEQLHDMRLFTKVTCGALDSRLQGFDVTSKRPFRLAAIVANNWPGSESDAQSLQKFGMYILAQWGLLPFYNGVDARSPHDHVEGCPLSAVLIILPSLGQAFLASPSCEFICAERGGPEVVAQVQLALSRGYRPSTVVRLGIEAVKRTLGSMSDQPLSLSEPAQTRNRRLIRENEKWKENVMVTEGYWNLVQRTVFIGLGGAMVFITAAFLYFNCRPAPPSLRRK